MIVVNIGLYIKNEYGAKYMWAEYIGVFMY